MQKIRAFANMIGVIERDKKYVTSAVHKIELLRSGQSLAGDANASGPGDRAPDQEEVKKHLSRLTVESEVAACFYLVLKSLGSSVELGAIADKCVVNIKKVKRAKKKIFKFKSY